MNKIKDICRKKCVSFSFILRIVMIISLILAIWRKDYVWVAGTFIGIFISILPSILKRDTKFTLPWVLDFLIALVTILHMGGRLLDFYYTIENYQIVTRFFISILVAFIGLAMIYVLDEHWDGLKMDKYAMGFVTVVFTISIGVFLEFIKFINITGTYYVRSNHVLMLNLSADMVAGIVIAIIGVNLIKSGRFDKITDEFGNQIDKMVIDKLENRNRNKKINKGQ
ncbi:hypothetical protein AYK24_07940 [Thermoplasmatales archaeon SG8-52-4]|nr:MAG: hypothetical protein AYK24_07940 [Thermoplasmatales archaeon SG8-52-4]